MVLKCIIQYLWDGNVTNLSELNWKQIGVCICCQWEQYIPRITKKQSSFRWLLLLFFVKTFLKFTMNFYNKSVLFCYHISLSECICIHPKILSALKEMAYGIQYEADRSVFKRPCISMFTRTSVLFLFYFIRSYLAAILSMMHFQIKYCCLLSIVK